jgi:hypothetical protein
MYSAVLTIHSFLRWLVILLGVWAVASAWRQRQPGGGRPPVLPGLLFSLTLDIQMLFGLLLYVALSPMTTAAMLDMGGVMKNGPSRFWTVEHPAMMILAVAFAHVARPRATGTAPGKRALVLYSLALLAILVAMPWPFTPQGRPWIRW